MNTMKIKNFQGSNKFEQIEQCINQTKNDKHRFILKLLYHLRLTMGMVINLKVKDIKDNILYCRGRRIYIPDSLMHDVYEYTNKRHPDEYLVMSNLRKKYHIRSIQEIRKQFIKKLKKT